MENSVIIASKIYNSMAVYDEAVLCRDGCWQGIAGHLCRWRWAFPFALISVSNYIVIQYFGVINDNDKGHERYSNRTCQWSREKIRRHRRHGLGRNVGLADCH